MAHGKNWTQAHQNLRCSPRWDDLGFDGVQFAGGSRLVENRRCPECGSTISREVSAQRAGELLSRQSELLAASIGQVALTLAVRPQAEVKAERARAASGRGAA